MTVKLDSFPNPYLVIFPRGAVSATTKSILTTGKVWEHWLCHVNIRRWEWRISTSPGVQGSHENWGAYKCYGPREFCPICTEASS